MRGGEQDVAAALRRRSTRSASGRIAREAVERHRHAAELARRLDRALEGAVGDHQRADALGEQLARRELAHLAGADQQRRLVVEGVEDVARQLDRRRADRHRLLGDAGLGAHALGHRERLVEAAMQHAPRRADGRGHRVLLLQLAEDLRLADDHRVEARGDAEEVAHGLAPVMHVEVRRQRVGVDAVRAARGTTAGSAATASASLPQATTSTRLQVETITPSSTPGSSTRRAQRRLEPAVRERHRARAPRPARCGGSGRRRRCSRSTLRTPFRGARGRAR